VFTVLVLHTDGVDWSEAINVNADVAEVIVAASAESLTDLTLAGFQLLDVMKSSEC